GPGPGRAADGARAQLASPVRRAARALRRHTGDNRFGREDGGRGMTTFVALGDSITLGIGDPVRLPPADSGRGGGKVRRGWRGWAVLLADGLVDADLHIVAGNGACMADLER